MSYNKLSNQFNILNNLQSSTGSAIIEDVNKRLIFTNNFKISDKIDKNIPQIDKILIDSDTMYVSGGILLQNESTTSNLKLLTNTSKLIFSSSNNNSTINTSLYIDSNSNTFLSNSLGNIIISGNMYINGTTNFLNEVTGSIIYLTNTENVSNQIIKNKGGNINIDIEVDVQNNKNYKIKGSTLVNQNLYKGITYLSNDINKCVNSNGTYAINKDIFVLKGNEYNQIEIDTKLNVATSTNNPTFGLALANPPSELASNTVPAYGNYLKEHILSAGPKYDLIPQAIIIRPGNDIDNIESYFIGDSHSIKIKNNDIPFFNDTNNQSLSSLYILDMTNQNFINSLQKGFKWNILLDDFDSNAIITKYETNTGLRTSWKTTTPINKTGDFKYINYLPWGFLDNTNYINKSKLEKLYRFGLLLGSQSVESVSPTITSFLDINTFSSRSLIKNITYISNGWQQTGGPITVQVTSTSNNQLYCIYNRTPATPATNRGITNRIMNTFKVENNSFFIQLMNNTIRSYTIDQQYNPQIIINNIESYQTIYTYGFKKIGTNTYFFILDNLTNIEKQIDVTSMSTVTYDWLLKFTWKNGKLIHSEPITNTNNSNLNYFNPDNYNDLAFDFGGLEYPTLFAVELPIGHTILNTEEWRISPQNDYVFKHKNSCDFYLWGDKANLTSNVLSYKDLYIKGGWLRINDDSNLPFGQTEKKESSYTGNDSIKNYEFKKAYKNLFLITANTVYNANDCFNWKKYSIFSLVYLGDNKWIIN